MQHTVFKWLFYLSVLWGASIFWIAPHPPMVDLAQHAGQVSLLHDLVTGTSPWSDIFKTNLFTPYLLGYGLAFPLSFVMPVVTALKVVLSLAYIAFVFSLVALRRHFGADPRLDWLFLLPFFGHAYNWGFFTFLAAAPVAVWFILTVDRYAQAPTRARGWAAMLVGLGLLMSHGLMFVFGMAVAGCIFTLRCRSVGEWLRRVWPLVIPGIACVAYFVISSRMQDAYGGLSNAGAVVWEMDWKRLPKIFINSLGVKMNLPIAITSVVLVVAPWLLGLRVDRKQPVTWVMFAIVLVISLTVPMFAMATGSLYMRFALFAFPAYALMFTLYRQTAADRPSIKHSGAPADATGGTSPAGPAALIHPARRTWIAMPILLAGCWLMLGSYSLQAWRFGKESADFKAIEQAMAPQQRAVSLAFTRRSEAANNDYAYLHYATWYQSEKQGLVDFNFAWFPPQIARFKPDHLPAVTYDFEHKPNDFDWKKHHGDLYRYIVTRHTEPLPADLFKGAACPPVERLTSGSWTLFERRDCHVASR